MPLEAHLAALRMLVEERARAGEAVEEARRLERQHMALGYELRKYQAALEANASSLVEREARAQEAEAKAKEAEAHLVEAQEEADARRVELEQEQASARTLAQRVEEERVARKRAEEELRAARERVGELEAQTAGRKPWWKRMFG